MSYESEPPKIPHSPQVPGISGNYKTPESFENLDISRNSEAQKAMKQWENSYNDYVDFQRAKRFINRTNIPEILARNRSRMGMTVWVILNDEGGVLLSRFKYKSPRNLETNLTARTGDKSILDIINDLRVSKFLQTGVLMIEEGRVSELLEFSTTIANFKNRLDRHQLLHTIDEDPGRASSFRVLPYTMNNAVRR